MQIPTFPKHPIDLPATPEAWDEPAGAAHHPVLIPLDAFKSAVRLARLSGFVIGVWVSVIAVSLTLLLRELVLAYWPVACDGIDDTLVCTARIAGGML